MNDQHVDQVVAQDGGFGHPSDLRIREAGVGFQLQRLDRLALCAHESREADHRAHILPTLAEGGQQLARRKRLALKANGH
jgi:hypothetical protein